MCHQFSSVAQSCPTLWDPMNRSTPGLPVHHQLPEFTQTHVHQVDDAIQPSHPLSSGTLMAGWTLYLPPFFLFSVKLQHESTIGIHISPPHSYVPPKDSSLLISIFIF